MLDAMTNKRSRFGFGNVLIAVYAVFSLSATARATFQIATKFSEAELPYLLSLLAALIYIVATVALVRRQMVLARAAIFFELIGVLLVGALSVAFPELFNHPSVWSKFGAGYGYVPLVLPIAGIFWVRKVRHD